MAKIIGIDLGTTNSVAAVMQGGEPIVIPSAEGERLVPSVVAVNKNHERLVGRIARNQVSPEEREELINILEELLMTVRLLTCERPARSVSPRGERRGNADP